MPRGRIELPTPAFSGPRSTDELPRHGDNQRFYGKDAKVKRENAWANRSDGGALLRGDNKFEVESLRSSRSGIDRDGPELRFALVNTAPKHTELGAATLTNGLEA